MHRINWVGTAILVVALAATIFLLGSFLPFFLAEVWGPLWGVEWWPPGVIRSFGRVGPLGGVSQWAVLLAVPISSILVLLVFVLVVASVLLGSRSGGSQSR